MGRKKSPNAALIAALTPPKPLPYDPELLQAVGQADALSWRKFDALRVAVYRRVMPTVWVEHLAAKQAGDDDRARQIDIDADRQWAEAMGVPPLTSFSNLEIVMATVEAAGYPATESGLHAWVIARRDGSAVGPARRDNELSKCTTKSNIANTHAGERVTNVTDYWQRLVDKGLVLPLVGSGQKWHARRKGFTDAQWEKLNAI